MDAFLTLTLSENDKNYAKMFTTLFRNLRSLAISNMEYFKCGSHGYHARYHIAFCVLFEHLELGIHPSVNDLIPHLNRFDLSPDEPANGYRSLLDVVHKCCLHLVQLCRHISVNRGSLFFRSAHYCRELECFVETLGQLRACLYYAQKLIKYCQKGNLFPEDEYMTDNVAEELMMEVELLSQDCFYGRCLGFQFCESMQKPLNVVSIAMASFSEGYQETSNMMQLASSLFNSGKYILNPDLRAQQVVSITRTADISFCKAFWSITEASIMQQLPYLVGPSIQVDNLITLSPETFEISNREGSETVTITPPCAHRGPSPVQVRLLSHKLRQGQKNSDGLLRTLTNRSPEKCLPMSPCLVVHCHGGGFVAQSSKSHEVYLRQWANDLEVPILSIDYSLAPENPFPRAVEECFYVYAWALKNCRQLGSTGEVVCLAGDSAGGNLMVSTALRAGSYRIQLPNGIMAAYTPFMVRYTPSPSRILCLMDPLLPVGILSRCLAAYAGIADEFSNCVMSPASSPDSMDNENVEQELKQNSSGKEENTCTIANEEHDVEQSTVCQSERMLIDQTATSTELFEKLGSLEASVSGHQTPEFSISEMEESEKMVLNSSKSNIQTIDVPDSLENSNISFEPQSEHYTLNDSTAPDNSFGEFPDVQATLSTSQCKHQTRQLNCSKLSRTNLRLDIESLPHNAKVGSMPKCPSMPVIGTDFSLNRNTRPTTPFVWDRHPMQSPLQLFRHLPVVNNPYMSPLVAPDDMLKDLPDICLVACHLDPILDDSVMFAKRLRRLGKNVDLHVIEDLPHGFLNFSLVSKDAKQASDVCISKIQKMLKMGMKIRL